MENMLKSDLILCNHYLHHTIKNGQDISHTFSVVTLLFLLLHVAMATGNIHLMF